jgi:xylulokinase
MHGATLLDASDKVLRPCILWNDTRSHVEAAALDADLLFRKVTGNIVFPGFTAPKLAWVKNNEPEIFAAVAKVLLPKDYLRLWLTGEHISEMSDSAGTAWLDVEKRAWSPELLAATDLDEAHMPRLVEGTEPGGSCAPNSPRAGACPARWSWPAGQGTMRRRPAAWARWPGRAFVSLGTSGVLFAANEQLSAQPESAVHTFCHALPDTWHQMGVILSATDCLNWLEGVTGTDAAQLTGALGDNCARPPASPSCPICRASARRTMTRHSRRLHRACPPVRPHRSHPGRARRRGLCAARQSGGAEGGRHHARSRHGDRRRLALDLLAQGHRHGA